ncbi:MAG: hypothetical protein IKT44_01650 [Clostridia bacterium]|nr:hypothetical protein [Clostridia bacterium]
MIERVCCFIGHREVEVTEELKEQINFIVEKLVIKENVKIFLFGSKSQFNDVCYEQVTKIKEKHPDIKRVYVRAEFLDINENYKSYLLERYEETYFSKKAVNVKRAVYVQRNYEMINKSQYCVFYYKEDYLPKNRKSGTKIAFDYAVKNRKKIIRLPRLI